jgi:transposase-like protein
MKTIKSTNGRKGQKGRTSNYEVAFRREVAKRYNEGNKSMAQIGQQFAVTADQVKGWVKQYSSELAVDPNDFSMTEQEAKELDLLKKQNQALKKKLEYEQMRNFALETMVDLAKSEMGIDLRKNSGAKQPKE